MKRTVFLILCTFMISLGLHAQEEVEKVVPAEKVKVFPNPATNVVNVLGLQNSDRAEIKVYDSYGNPVLEHHWKIKNKALNIPIASLNSGIYLITIRSEGQHVKTKFYKQ